jgi:Na+/melibiose symporter-like transporter
MYLFIGGGIILRKETARVALIAMSVIAIIVSIYGLFTYMQVAKEYDDLLATQQSRTSTLDDTKSGASAAQASDSAVSQKATNQLLSLGANSTSSSYMSYYIAITVFSFVINSIIIVFLTRPTVRRSFR